MRVADQQELDIYLAVVVEKRKSSHLWADYIWTPIAAFQNPADNTKWKELLRENDNVQYHAATLPLNLHHKETEPLRLNLMLDQPELYVVLQEDEEGNSDFPYSPLLVTASSFEAQDYDDAGEYITGKIAMPESVAALIQAFVERHHKEEKFIKRRRDKLNVEELKFGKEPIFSNRTRH